MDNHLSVHQKHPSNHANKANKKSKKKKQPFKVVYISNPLKVTLTADNFRARVQELTGRESNVADEGVAGFSDTSYDTTSPVSAAAAAVVGPRPDSNRLADEYSFGAVAPLYDQMFGEAFSAPQAPGNFPGLFYEPRTEGGFSHAA